MIFKKLLFPNLYVSKQMCVHIVSFIKHWVQVWVLYWAPAQVGWRTTTGTTSDVAWLSVCTCVLRYRCCVVCRSVHQMRTIHPQPYSKITSHKLRCSSMFFFLLLLGSFDVFLYLYVKRLRIIPVCFISTSRLFLLEPYIRTHAVYISLHKTLHGGLPVLPIN